MTESEKKIWIKIRAEHIQHWQLTGPNKQQWSMEQCLETASGQLEVQLERRGEPFISLVELLTLENDDAIELEHKRRHGDFIAKFTAAE